MTRKDIEKMEPGRELDFLIAVHVMNLCVLDNLQSYGDGCVMSDKGMDGWFKHPEYGKMADPNSLEPYSSNISAAWELVDKITEKSEKDNCGPIVELTHDGVWHMKIGLSRAVAATAPLAICKAALLAVMNL